MKFKAILLLLLGFAPVLLADQSMVIKVNGYSKSETLTNFPLLVTFSTNNPVGFNYGGFLSPYGYDLRFTSSTGSELPYEIETWNANADIADISGLLMWLKADSGAITNESGVVTNWLDQSGNGYFATNVGNPELITTGIVGSATAVYFSGLTNAFVSNLTTPTNTSIFTVFKQGAHTTIEKSGPIWQADPSQQRSGFFPWYKVNTNQYLAVRNETWRNKISTFSVDTPWLADIHYNGTAQNTKLFKNGAYNDQSLTNAPANSGLFTIGRRLIGETNYFTGQIAEILIYNRVLSASEAYRVRQYCANKYGLAFASMTSYIWVKVPTLANGTTIMATWGNSDDMAQQAYTTNGATWDSNFQGVWHLASSSMSTSLDSTAYFNNGPMGTTTTTNSGVVDGAGLFDGTSSYISGAAPAIAADFTFSAWVRPSVLGRYAAILDKRDGGTVTKGYLWGYRDGDASHKMSCSVSDGSTAVEVYGISPLVTTAWNHVAVTVVRGGNITHHFNGLTNGSGSIATVAGSSAATNTSSIGWKSAALTSAWTYWPGMLDEIRISASIRSTNWLWAEWFNMASNSVFQTYTMSNLDGGIPYYKNKLNQKGRFY